MNSKPLNMKSLSLLLPIAALSVVTMAGCQNSASNDSSTPPTTPPKPQGGATTSAPPPTQAGDLPPLIQAAQKGDADEVQKQIAGGADVNAAAANGATALTRTTKAAIAKLLLDKGAKVDATDGFGRTALIYAAGDNDRAQGGGGPGGGGGNSGPKEEPSALVSLLLSHHADPNITCTDGTTALLSAIARHKVISGPFDIAGSENARVAKVRLLLAAGAKVNTATKTETPDHLSAGETPLMAAAQNGDPVLLKLLLDKGADVNAVDQTGTTALMRAARIGNPDEVEMLIAHHADVNARTSKGETALSMASRMKSHGLQKAVEILTKAGAK